MVAPVLQLSPEQAYALTAAHAVLFVGSLYVGRRTDLPRDHPRVIQARIGRVLGAIALSVVLTAWVAHQYRAHSDWTGAATFRALLHQGGFTNHNWSVALAWGLGSILTLFAGPLYVDYLAVRHQPRWPIVVARHWAEDLSTLVGWRNLVLAPLFEEAVFRGLVVPLWLNAGLSLPITVFASPVIFGLSHLHHAVECYRTTGNAKRAIVVPAFQAAYSSVFGWFAAFLLLHTNSLVAPVVGHAVCNALGLPDIGPVVCFPDQRFVTAIRSAYALGITFFAILIYFGTQSL